MAPCLGPDGDMLLTVGFGFLEAFAYSKSSWYSSEGESFLLLSSLPPSCAFGLILLILPVATGVLPPVLLECPEITLFRSSS